MLGLIILKYVIIIFICLIVYVIYLNWRTKMVYDYRSNLIDNNFYDQYKKLPSEDYMINHFWVWSLKRFMNKEKDKKYNLFYVTIFLLTMIAIYLSSFNHQKSVKYRYLTVIDKDPYLHWTADREHDNYPIIFRSEENLIIYCFNPQTFYLLNPGDIINANVKKIGTWSDGIIKYEISDIEIIKQEGKWCNQVVENQE